MQLAVRMEHHDHEYVERRGGWVLYSYMRAAATRSRYRRLALERATKLYAASRSAGEPGTTVGGHGLLVIQRAFLAAEDLGRLLHALGDQAAWGRLTGANLDELDATFAQVISDAPGALRPFLIADTEVLRTEGYGPTVIAGLERLAQLESARWLYQLQTVAAFWLKHRAVAKATMHGFPILAGDH